MYGRVSFGGAFGAGWSTILARVAFLHYGRGMAETLEIRERDRQLVVDVFEREHWTLFRRRFGPPAVGMTLVMLFPLAFLVTTDGLSETLLVRGAVIYGASMALVAICVYFQVLPVSRGATIRLDDSKNHLSVDDGRTSTVYSLASVQMVQVSEMTLPWRAIRTDTRSLLPGDEQYELSLVTDEGIDVVARGLAKSEAEQVVRSIHRRLPNRDGDVR